MNKRCGENNNKENVGGVEKRKMRSGRGRFGKALVFAFVIFATLAFVSVECASATTHYVNPGDSIQAAVDAASPDDTVFVYNGTYYEAVTISKDRITLQGEDANTTTIHGMWTAEKVVYVTGNYVNVSEFTVTGSASGGTGIYAEDADNCNIFGNIIKSVYHGIRLRDHSDNTIVSHNNVSECIFGINGFYSSNCSISDNTVNSNSRYGIVGTELDNCKLENNVANLNDGYGIFLEASSNCNLKKNVANSNLFGLGLYDSNNCTIDNNIASLNSYCGITLWLSSNNIITGNTLDAAIGSTDYGIRIESTSVNNEITENNISNNIIYGMYLDYSSNNKIYHNNFINNNNQAYDHHGFNDWGKGQILGGNYWSDHNCTGNPSNGTEPYTKIDTDAGAVDNYPFQDPNGWFGMNIPPVAYFTDSPENPVVNETITFDASGSSDTDGNIVSYEWDFGDGNTGTGEIATHSYSLPENYTITLTVTDDGGATNSATKGITVQTAPDTTPPTVAVTSPNGGEVWNVGTTHYITWTATDDVGVTSIHIYYSTNGGSTYPYTIATGEPNDGTCTWTIPDTPSTACKVKVVAHDAAGKTGEDASNANFEIHKPDTTPPVISGVNSSSITSSSATITWNTDELSDSRVKYGTISGNYPYTEYDATDVTSHSISLTGLSASTTYYYVVNSTDPSGNSAESTEYSFTTLPNTTVTSITISPSTATINISETQQFTATAYDQDGNTMAGVVISWASTNTSVGTVSPIIATTGADGTATTTFTAVAEGTTMVIANNGTVSDSASVTVTTDWNPWDDDGVITTAEIQEAVSYWLTDTPINGHLLTTAEIQELVALWLTSP